MEHSSPESSVSSHSISSHEGKSLTEGPSNTQSDSESNSASTSTVCSNFRPSKFLSRSSKWQYTRTYTMLLATKILSLKMLQRKQENSKSIDRQKLQSVYAIYAVHTENDNVCFDSRRCPLPRT